MFGWLFTWPVDGRAVEAALRADAEARRLRLVEERKRLRGVFREPEGDCDSWEDRCRHALSTARGIRERGVMNLSEGFIVDEMVRILDGRFE